MTSIRDDDPAYHQEEAGTTTTDRIREVETRAEDTTRRLAAAVAGALDGFVEALDRYDLGNETERAAHQAGEIARAAAVEGRTVAQSPEMQKVGHGMQKAGEKVGDGVHRAQEGVQRAADSVRTTTHDLRDSAVDAAHQARDTARRVKEGVQVRAEAVAETGRRARAAPRIVGHELSEAFRTWRRALMTSIAMGAALVLFAGFALVVLTIALVVGLNELVGDPLGTFLVAFLYVIAAGIAYAVARSARARAAVEREERMANAREELRHVARPVKNAFSRGRAGI